MDSKYHLLSSVTVGFLSGFAVGAPPEQLLALMGYAAVLGVGIDLDHFLLARYHTGTWRALRGCLRDPRLVLFEQDAIFRVGEVGRLHRLLSHVIHAGVLTAALAFLEPSLAALTAAVLYVHVLLDLAQDVRDVGHEPG